MKSKKVMARIRADIEVPFWSYPTKGMNRKAKQSIIRWVRFAIKQNVNYITLYNIEPDCEDCTMLAKISVKGKL